MARSKSWSWLVRGVAQLVRPLQYLSTSFSNILRCECTSSMMSLHSGTSPISHPTSIIWLYTLKSWFGSHCGEALVTVSNDFHCAYQDYWTPSSSSRMGGLFQNVFSCEAPVSPSEITDLVQSVEIQYCKVCSVTGHRAPSISHLPADCLSLTA